jgi:hypothetical protein|tara:strand:- start:126 stop:386 length:261 start_codon:yes stop_codon:yes gene_type:complete
MSSPTDDIKATRGGTYLALGTVPNDGHKFMSVCLAKADTGEILVVIGGGKNADPLMIQLPQSTFEDWRDWLNEVLPITATHEGETD